MKKPYNKSTSEKYTKDGRINATLWNWGFICFIYLRYHRPKGQAWGWSVRYKEKEFEFNFTDYGHPRSKE